MNVAEAVTSKGKGGNGGAALAAEALSAVSARAAYKIDPKKKVAICGFASSSRNSAPFGDDSFEIWGLNSLYAMIPRFTRWFEIHPKEHFVKDLNRAELKQIGVDHYDWLKKQPGPGEKDYAPIYMQEHYPEIPASVPWPRQAINDWTTAMFGPEAELDYFTSTPGEMVALAIFEGFGEIHVYGVDLLQSEEYAYQRPGCEYWLGIARGLGIKVVVPHSSALIKASYVYGYTEPPSEAGLFKPLADFFAFQSTKIEQNQHQIVSVVNTIQGCRQMGNMVMAMITEGKTVAEIKEKLVAELDTLAKKFDEGKDNLHKMAGSREFATSAASWTEHFGRGGKLDGMGSASPLALVAAKST